MFGSEGFLLKFSLLGGVALCTFFALYPFATQINEFILKYTVGQRNTILEKLNEIFIEISPQKLLNILIGFSVGFGTIFFLISIPHFIVAFILFCVFTLVGWFIPPILLKIYLSKRTEKFNIQLIDALSLMSAGLRAGQSITQSMELIVNEMPNPISQEFELVLKQNRLGMSVSEALEAMASRVKSDDCYMFVTSVNILEETGGNLITTFDTISTVIRDRIKLEMKIAGLTAMARNQGLLVLIIPLILILMNYFEDPDSISIFFKTQMGIIIFLGATALWIFGGFLLWKVSKIRV